MTHRLPCHPYVPMFNPESTHDVDPESEFEARHTPRASREIIGDFLDAANREISELQRKETFKYVERPKGTQIVPLLWVFVYKFDKDGFLLMNPAFLLAKPLYSFSLWTILSRCFIVNFVLRLSHLKPPLWKHLRFG